MRHSSLGQWVDDKHNTSQPRTLVHLASMSSNFFTVTTHDRLTMKQAVAAPRQAQRKQGKFMRKSLFLMSPLTAAVVLCCAGGAHAQATLSGWALMPANTFSDGPTTGQFAGSGAGGNALPLLNKQSVQGISAVLNGPAPGTFLVMPDNGFGTQANSADALAAHVCGAARLPHRHRRQRAPCRRWTTTPARHLARLQRPAAASRLSDPDRRLGFTRSRPTTPTTTTATAR